MDERRQHERHLSFEVVEVIVEDKDGNRETINVMLRDRSDGGIGGVYIGQAALGPDTAYHLKQDGQESRRMRLAWKKVAAKYVCILGFELLSSP